MILEQHFQTAPQNARYNSPQIQNELISCAGEWIQQQILSEIKDATFFSVCADEAADCSNKEQLPLVLRFVDKVNTIREVFVEFVVCDTGTTGQAIAEKILEALKRYGLDISCLRGQCYDGAGNMAGKYKGAAKVVQDTCPKAVYVHCAAHVLNLCVVGACKVQLVKNMMGTMVEICLFFSNSPKRQIVETFSIISSGSSSGWNSESCRAAESLLICITRYQFIISFVVAKECLQYTKGLTVSLQKRANDICQAYSDVKTVIATLQDVRKNMVSKHRTWHETAITLGEKVNASQPQLPRRCSVQTSRSNTPGETPEVYYRLTSCECERSVSVLRRLKTYLRSTMGQERLSGLALLHTQYGMKLNLDEIVNMFARKHSRRMELMDILSEFDEADED
ncbi:52 kDa repressor of the inhibitor of the protein kinase-like [Halichondria panicea]|uniref:52 kDa repressor of the inhibitor of the protein kinase-like n=1 Tax=Halichondria panicea TaxID=6063 RepID=UPI00312B6759